MPFYNNGDYQIESFDSDVKEPEPEAYKKIDNNEINIFKHNTTKNVVRKNKNRWWITFVNLFKVKSIISLACTALFSWLTLTDRLEVPIIMTIITAVLIYYFQKKDNSDGNNNM